MTIARTLLVLIALCCLAAPVQAQDLEFELTPYGGYRFGGKLELAESNGSYKLDDSGTFGVLLNWRHSANTQWEVLYSQQQSDARLSNETNLAPRVSTDFQTLQLGGTYQGDGEKVRPYVALTVGGTHVKANANGSESDTFFSGSLGLGVNFLPTKRIGLRLEARGHMTFLTSSTSLLCKTGPDANVCSIRITGDTLNQVETFAGIVFRF